MAEWWQVDFTSSDSVPGTPGGWGVKRARPEEAKTIHEQLISGADTRMPAGDDVGDFPTAEMLELRLRQLISRNIGADRVLTHAIAAGADATGRPGNVYIHAALAKGALPALGIEYWRSPSWLVPYGPRAVGDATLPESIESGTSITRDSIARFLSEDPQRLDMLAVLTEAIFPAARSESVVILLANDSDEVARWIAALSYIRDPRADAFTSWATWARADALSSFVDLGIRVIGVSNTDGDLARSWARNISQSIVIDTSTSVQRIESGWRVQGMSSLINSDWGTILIDSLKDPVAEFGPELLTDVFDGIANISEGASNDYVDALWALAGTVLVDPDIELPDRKDMTLSLVVLGPSHTPTGVAARAVDELWRRDESAALQLLDHQDFFPLGIARRVALLLAGELVWNSDIDGRVALKEDSRAFIEDVIGRALEIHDNLKVNEEQPEERARLEEIFIGYALNISSGETVDQSMSQSEEVASAQIVPPAPIAHGYYANESQNSVGFDKDINPMDLTEQEIRYTESSQLKRLEENRMNPPSYLGDERVAGHLPSSSPSQELVRQMTNWVEVFTRQNSSVFDGQSRNELERALQEGSLTVHDLASSILESSSSFHELAWWLSSGVDQISVNGNNVAFHLGGDVSDFRQSVEYQVLIATFIEIARGKHFEEMDQFVASPQGFLELRKTWDHVKTLARKV